MLPQKMKSFVAENPKKLGNLINLVNLPSALKDFMGQSQTSRLGCFKRIWSYIKENNLQDPNNKNLVNCDEKLKSILLGIAAADRSFKETPNSSRCDKKSPTAPTTENSAILLLKLLSGYSRKPESLEETKTSLSAAPLLEPGSGRASCS
nr:upstream activation factor subunit spp27 [Ipomoea batatas]